MSEDVPEPRPKPVTGAHAPPPDAIPVVRLVAAVGTAALAHLLCALGLLELVSHGADWLADGPRLTVVLIALVTATVALAGAVRARRDGLDRVTWTVPVVFALTPPLVGAACLPLMSMGGVPWQVTLVRTTTAIAAGAAPGIALALTLEHTLWTLNARLGELAARRRRETGTPKPEPEPAATRLGPPPLTARLGRLVGGLALAVGLLMFAHALVMTSDLIAWTLRPRTWLASAAIGSALVIAVLAAASAAMSPGRDVLTLAARLDAIGWDEPSAQRSAAARSLESPVRVTSFDAVGDLFRNLERLRASLAKEAGSYQIALDRTRAADEAKAEFLAAVSHELRTPLNSIMGFAQLLLESELTESQAEDVRLILAGGRQLHELIEDILDLSMIESGELELRFAPCDVLELVEELVDIHQAQVRERGLTLASRHRGEIPTITCDRKRIGQVLTNLLSNAIKFTEAGGVSVTVQLDARRRRVAVAIADTGVGIDAEELSAIFEEYHQAGARKRKLRGTGLGLAIARRIAEAHGGSLSATSEIGVGSTFTLHLPLEASREDEASERGAESLEPVRSSSSKLSGGVERGGAAARPEGGRS